MYHFRRDHLDIKSAGVALVYMFPAAFVTLDDLELQSASHPSRLRILSGGILHNALLALVCWLLSSAGLGIGTALQSVSLWEDVGSVGVVVESIAPVSPQPDLAIVVFDLTFTSSDQASPIQSLLFPGDIISRIDDVELHDSDQNDHWDHFLSQPVPMQPSYDSMGWCMDSSALAGRLLHSARVCL